MKKLKKIKIIYKYVKSPDSEKKIQEIYNYLFNKTLERIEKDKNHYENTTSR